MKEIGRLLSVITWVLVVGSVIVLTGGVFGRPLLLAAVPTGSMFPVLKPGDLIVILPTWFMGAPGLDEIVVFKTPDSREWIVHRIVEGNGVEGFVTRGDANPTVDPERVSPRDIAGIVPHWNGGALRLPRLGLLSVEQGPLSSPVVAGVALVMGIYLLLLDGRPRVKLPHLRHHGRRTLKAESVASLYVGLSAMVFVTTLIPAWSLSGTERIEYQVVALKPASLTVKGLYVKGEPHREEAPVVNPSPVPLIVLFQPQDPGVTLEPSWAIIPPRREATFQWTVDTSTVGKYTSEVRTGVLIPLLPPALLGAITSMSMLAASMVNALVPASIVLSIALLDPRCRSGMARWRLRLTARMLS